MEVAEKPRRGSPSFKMPPETDEGFEGKTMTEAQDKIIGELFELEDEEYGLTIEMASLLTKS